MERQVIYESRALYRDDFRVEGFAFGRGEPALCVVGSMRGNEYQQLYTCSQLVRRLGELEERGRLAAGKQILVIPCVNPYSMNAHKRFWPIDNTDINRMFPGYALGETTQRIAAGVFSRVQHFTYGVQFSSFYMPGAFVPHVRITKTGYEDAEMAVQFGLPYVILHPPRPFDTTTLNYNWQIWETKAFTLYTASNAGMDQPSAKEAVEAVLGFMAAQGLLRYRRRGGRISRVVDGEEMIPLHAERAGFFESFVRPGQEVEKGDGLARILDPYLGVERCRLSAPESGTVAFVRSEAMTYESTSVIKLIPDLER